MAPLPSPLPASPVSPPASPLAPAESALPPSAGEDPERPPSLGRSPALTKLGGRASDEHAGWLASHAHNESATAEKRKAECARGGWKSRVILREHSCNSDASLSRSG